MYNTTAIDKKTQSKVEDLLWDIVDEWPAEVMMMYDLGGLKGLRRGEEVGYDFGKMGKYVNPSTWRMAEKVAKLLNDAAEDWYESTADAITKKYGKDVWDIDYDKRLILDPYDQIFAGDIIELLLDQTIAYENENGDWSFSQVEGRGIDKVLDELFEVRGWFALEYHDIVGGFA